MEVICDLVNCKKKDLVNTDLLIFLNLTAVVGGGETFPGVGEKGKQGQEQFKNKKV